MEDKRRTAEPVNFGYYNMDCMDGMKEFPDKYFDLAIVDPEYGRKEHGGRNRSGYVKQKNGSRIFVKDGQYINRGWDNKPAGKEYFDELMRVSKHQIIWGCNYFDYPLAGGLIIWDKCNDGSDQSDAEVAYNSMTRRVDIFRYMWRGMLQGKSIAEGTIQQGNKKLNEKRIHPTQKPVNLYRWILQKYKIPQDWKLLDTHVGSASSLIAFQEAGNPFVGFERDEDYYAKSVARMEAHKSQRTDMERKEVCGTCKFNRSRWEDDCMCGYYCTNDESEAYGLHTAYDDTCGDWEGKDE